VAPPRAARSGGSSNQLKFTLSNAIARPCGRRKLVNSPRALHSATVGRDIRGRELDNWSAAPPRGSSASIRVVEALYEGFRRRDMAAMFRLLAEDVELEQSQALPSGGCYRGHDGARRFFGQIGSRVNSTLAFERLIDSGAHYRVPFVHLWRVRDGKIARAAFYIDHPRMLETLA
jgi:hypothetical protein